MSTDGEFVGRVLDASLCGIYVYNVVKGSNDYINSRYTEITGWTLDEINSMPAETFAELFHPEDREAVFAHMAQVIATADGGFVEIEYRFKTKDGRWIWCLSRDAPFTRTEDGAIVSFIGTFLDITNRKEQEAQQQHVEERLQQSQRLESLGVLAGGIAHDFNNLLMAILGHADLALEEISPASPGRESITEIHTGAQRAAELCNQLLTYSGRGSFERETLQLGNLIEEMLHMLKTSISKKCLLNLHLEKGLFPVQIDPAQVRQVMMNLVINASEAIGERSGVITISTGAMECNDDYVERTYTITPPTRGLFVYLEVSDTGCGMTRETMARVFEPFYTSKFTGRGLGLSAVLGIVRAHEGGLKIYSEPDKGTTFKVLFPAVTDAVELPNHGESGDHWTGEGTVLLVDDEETVRSISKKLLSKLGLTVLTAEDGKQAVTLYEKHLAEIDLVLLDLTMPHMNGEEAYRAMRALDPDVKVVLASGYSESDIASRFAGKGLVGCLQKPYTLRKLRNLLSGALPDAS